MKLLLKAALRAKRHLALFLATIVTMIALTLGTQFEMFTVGVITKQGADFFDLFGNKTRTESVNIDQVQERFREIDADNTGVITPDNARHYLDHHGEKNPLNRIFSWLQKKCNLSNKNLTAVIYLLVFVSLFKACGLFFSRYTTQILSIRISRDLRQQYFQHIQSLPMSFYQRYNIGALSSRVAGDATQIALSLNAFVTNYIHAPFTILSTLGICFYLSWQLSLVIFLALPMIVLPVVFLTRKVKNITRRLQKNQENFTSVLIDFLSGIQTVKIFAMEKFSFKKYKEQNDKMAHLESKTAKYDLLTRPILHIVTMACLGLVAVYGLHILKMSISELIVFCGMLYQFYQPVKKFAEENTNVQKGVVAAERLYEVLDLHSDIQDADDAIPLTQFEHSISFENVWFRYADEWVLKDLSFTVNKGETVAIVGKTGAGKSTIVQLLPRLYDVQKGAIKIDGVPITKYTQRSIRDKLAFVPQKPFLFFDTVEANIAFGKELSFKQVQVAAQKAHADEFIDLLPKGYATPLAETGKNLSGGQQQRLAIARALAKEAPILVLDEATSSLDAISENRIKHTIKELHGSLTQVIIAHRLTTIEHADRIIFLGDGHKIAEGTKDELIESCEEFRNLWETHFLIESNL